MSTEAAAVTADIIRAYIVYLRQKNCFEEHRSIRKQARRFSGHTVNGYLRALRVFFSWLVREEIIATHPFARATIPRPPRKVIATFSDEQFRQLVGVIDTSQPSGFRDFVILVTLLDTGLHLSELCGLMASDVDLERGMLKVIGKGTKERFVPFSRQVRRLLWQYRSRFGPVPLPAFADIFFLTREGHPVSKDYVERMMHRYGRRAGITGVRCSPHTLRHSAAVRFLRNGSNTFACQRFPGHSQLDMTRRYCELADIDVKKAHRDGQPGRQYLFPLKK